MFFFPRYTEGSTGGSSTLGEPYGSCFNTYCHSNGTSVYTGTIPHNTSPTWGSGAITCNACHSYPPDYASSPAKANSHAAHDMMHARMRAMEMGREHYVVFGPRSYAIIEDTNESGEPDAGDDSLPGFPKTVAYDLQRNVGAKVTFNQRGLISGLQRIWVASDTDPDYDCMRVSMSRVIMGRFVDGECLMK